MEDDIDVGGLKRAGPVQRFQRFGLAVQIAVNIRQEGQRLDTRRRLGGGLLQNRQSRLQERVVGGRMDLAPRDFQVEPGQIEPRRSWDVGTAVLQNILDMNHAAGQVVLVPGNLQHHPHGHGLTRIPAQRLGA